MKLLVAGSSGFVGRRLCLALVAAGHTVQAMTRHPETYSGAGQAVYGDVREQESLLAALAGCDVAFYLVHSLGDHRPDIRGTVALAGIRLGDQS